MAKVDSILFDGYFFPIWMQNFEGQLKKLHKELVVTDEDQLGLGLPVDRDFKDLDFMDFAILVYQERSDLIDYSQN